MSTPSSQQGLGADTLWLLVGIPVCIWGGVLWDMFQDAKGTQMFLGASHNFYLLWILPMFVLALPRALVRATRAGGGQRWTAMGLLALLAWIVLGDLRMARFSSLDDAVLPIVAVLTTTLAGMGWLLGRQERDAGRGAALERGVARALLLGGAGMIAGGVIHLLGELPDHQPFLYVDGFGNIRTLGEALMLALAAAVVWGWRGTSPWALAAVVVLATALAWTGSRACWVGLGGALVLGALWWRPGWKPFGITALALLVGALLSLPLPTPDGSYGIARSGALVEEAGFAIGTGLSGGGKVEVEDSSRMALWGWGVDRIREQPWYGHGLASMDSLPRPEEAHYKHLHNLPLDLAFGVGIPMAIVLTLLLLWAVLSSYAQAAWDGHYLLPMAAATALATSLFAGLFLFPITVAVAALGLSGAGWGRR